MHLRKIILHAATLITLLPIKSAYGQRTYQFDFEPDSTYQCAHRGLKVIDLRNNQSSMGHVKTMLGAKADLITPQPLATYLQDYYKTIITSNGDQELVLVIHGISIQDGLSQHIGTVYFDFDFFAGSNDKYYFIGAIDTIFETASAIDVTKKLLRGIQSSLTDIIINVARTEPAISSSYSFEQIKDRRKTIKQQYPIYNTTTFKEGIYLTKNDFLMHRPIDTGIMRTMVTMGTGTTTYNFYYLNERKKKGERIETENYFAIYSDGRWFSGRGDRPAKMELRDGDFYTTKFFRGIVKQNPNMPLSPGFVSSQITLLTFSGGDLPTGMVRYQARFNPQISNWKPCKRLD